MVLKPATGRQQIDFTPNWKALEDKLGARCQEFMFMGRMGSVNLYKHIPHAAILEPRQFRKLLCVPRGQIRAGEPGWPSRSH